jgi:acyl-coenzyme A thioesterase PaaI-like protein
MLLQGDGACFVCGKDNPAGLQLSFESRNGTITATFTPRAEHQGYKLMVHGGILSAVLDEASAWAAINAGYPALTAEINVRFKNILMTGEVTIVEAVLTKTGSRLIESRSWITRKDDGALIAEATVKLIPVKGHDLSEAG